MSDANLLCLGPFLALAAAAVVVMMISTFTRAHLVFAAVTGAGLTAAFVCVLVAAGSSDRRATSLLRLDDYALFFMGLLIVVALAVQALSYEYLERTESRRADFYVLLTLATLGATVLSASTHFASFFLGLEVLSVSLYGLIAYPERRAQALEAGFKYLVLAGTTSAFLLLGMALVYMVTGGMDLQALTAAAAGLSGWELTSYAVGLVLIFAGVGFKLAFVPFHLWTPDVYQGGPAPAIAFLATASKAAVFVVLVRFLGPLDPQGEGVLSIVFTVVAYTSMLAGNLLALLQRNLKRLLAYSSIAQLGYLSVALVAGGSTGRTAIAFYLAVYSLALVAAFGVVAVLSRADAEAELVDEYRGLGRRRPLLAIALSISMLSLAGVPLTAGFIGKFFIFRAGAGASLWGLSIVLALTSAMSLYYYMRVVVMMFHAGVAPSSGAGRALGREAATDRLASAAVSVLAVVTVILGVYPAPLLHLIERVVATLS
jgi:NADH-quinone oxidoreductase subunit N